MKNLYVKINLDEVNIIMHFYYSAKQTYIIIAIHTRHQIKIIRI